MCCWRGSAAWRASWPAWCPSMSCRRTASGEPPRFHRATSGTLLIGAGVPGLRELLDVPGAGRGRARRHGRRAVGQAAAQPQQCAQRAVAACRSRTQLADRRWRRLLARADRGGARRAEGGRHHAGRASKACRRGAIPRILRLPDWLFRRVARRMLAIDPQARSSMWEDLQRAPADRDRLPAGRDPGAGREDRAWRRRSPSASLRLVKQARERAARARPG